MVNWIIEYSVKHPWIIFGAVLVLVGWALDSIRTTPLDAVPDLSDPQVIIFTEWMGRSPDLVEDQITYPLVRALQSTPRAKIVRGFSMFGMSFIYVIFQDGTDIYWARTRVFEQLGRVQQLLPPDVTPMLGPDASGVGWVYQYVIMDSTGRLDLAQLRELQDFTIRPALQAVSGVAEVASLGGFERQYQVVLDPVTLAAFGLSISDVVRAVRNANAEVGARVLELAGREYVIRGRGYIRDLEDIEKSVISIGNGGIPIQVGDVATVKFGPEIRRGAADYNGEGEAVGGIVVMRIGSNALKVIEELKNQISELGLPKGVKLIPTYDRSELIIGSVETLRTTLIEEGIIVAIIMIVFLLHLGSALVAIIVLPVSVLISFIAIRYIGLTTNIMSLGGIAIAIGELADAAVILIENAHVRLSEAPPGVDRKRIIVDACKEVGSPIFYSLILITVSFLPIFTLAGQAGRLFQPLAFTKTFAMFAASILSITLAPPLMVFLLRGRIRKESENPVNRFLSRMYFPVAKFVVKYRNRVIAGAAVIMLLTVPVFMRLGSEFMPPLDEGSLLVMPTTFAGISIEEARRALNYQHRIIMQFPEVESVHGKAGRAETATDPAQIEMNESVVSLKSRDKWPKVQRKRWYSNSLPDWLKPPFRVLWPDRRKRTIQELSMEMNLALKMPGYQMSVSPPIRTRIDMLTTGVRTPVGIKVFGDSLEGIESLSVQLESLLRTIPGTLSTFAERQSGREYIDIRPDRDAIARYGLTIGDVNSIIESAIGGLPVSTVISGRSRFSINIRYAPGYRADPEAIRRILISVPLSQPQIDIRFPGKVANSGTKMGGQAQMNNRSASDVGDMSSETMEDGGMNGGASASSSFLSNQGTNGIADRWKQPGATVNLGSIADVRIILGPPMIRDENGVLVGYVYADIDMSERDIGGWVIEAKQLVSQRIDLPSGYQLQWTGQYEYLAQMEERLRYVLPLTFILIVLLLYMSLRGWPQTFLVLLSLPFAIAGSIWLLALMGYNLSTAVWVGIIAVGGVAAQTGIVMIVYLDEAYLRYKRENKLNKPEDVDHAVIEGASTRVRPLVMTVATTVLGLMPLLWESGPGADISARTAAPVIGGLWSAMLLTLLVLPAAYTIWRKRQMRA